LELKVLADVGLQVFQMLENQRYFLYWHQAKPKLQITRLQP
jgi:hypothetical protein